jgi:hypothetical protein
MFTAFQANGSMTLILDARKYEKTSQDVFSLVRCYS